ncbi:uncharacterized protein [Scyliorhinus torazame]|uniref:uncharacterized protein isoform X1 n=2 Tax=Scyliorhinus torazame TaxID=75743 RepID=UPI003B5AE7A0
METLYKTKLITSEQRLQREISSHVTLHKRPSIRSQEILRLTDDLLAASKPHLSGVTETRACMKTSVPHLPKIHCTVLQKNVVKGSEVPFSSIVDFFMERKKTLKLNGFHWQRTNIAVPSNVPLVIRSYGSRTCENVEDAEKRTGNGNGRKVCGLGSSTVRNILQHSAEESTYKNPNCAELADDVEGDSSSLQHYPGAFSPKCQRVGLKVGRKFRIEHGYTVDDDDIKSVRSIKSVKSVNSSSDSVASTKWSKGFVRKPGVNQHRSSATYFSETGNTRVCRSGLNVKGASCPKHSTAPSVRKLKSISSKRCDPPVTDSSSRTELEHICRLPFLNGISLDMEIEHRSVSQANCTGVTGSDKLCFDDNGVGNTGNGSAEKGADPDPVPQVVTKITFQSPVVQDFSPLTPNHGKPEGKMNRITKQLGSKVQPTKYYPLIATSSSKPSQKFCTSKTSETAVCCSTISKCSDNEEYKVSLMASEDEIEEECIFDFNRTLREKGNSSVGNTRIALPAVKCRARYRNQKQPMKSSLKKSFDWRSHSQTKISEDPKTREEWKDDCVKAALERNVKAGLKKKHLVPLYQSSLNQEVQGCTCSICEECTVFCSNCHCGQLSLQQQNVRHLGLLNAMQQKLKQLYYCESTEQNSHWNNETAVDTNASSNQLYYRENHTFQGQDEQDCLQLPQTVDFVLCKTPSPERTVELSSSLGGKVPKITMTCPTPVPCRTYNEVVS